jgi:hypothetical protein
MITTVPDESCQDGTQKHDGRQAGAPDPRITTVPDETVMIAPKSKMTDMQVLLI